MPVAAFYRFAAVRDPVGLQARLRALPGLTGSIILAVEGVNGTVAGSDAAIGTLMAVFQAEPGFTDLTARLSPGDSTAFGRWKVKVKPEIVTFGPAVDARQTGTKVAPAAWNAVFADPGTVTIDTRNGFEVAQGTFPGAINPGTQQFGDLPAWWAAQGAALQGKRIAMFCTGGIRCEKASAWLLAQGVPQVVQLDGGILGYLAQVPVENSLWQGRCFVFDERGALGPGLDPE